MIDALAQLSKDSVAAEPVLTEALKNDTVDVRIRAAVALGTLGPKAKSALPALIEAAKDTGNIGSVLRVDLPSSVTEAAIGAALKIDPSSKQSLADSAVASLIVGIQGKNMAVRQAAAYALGMLGPSAKPALPALKDAPPPHWAPPPPA